MINVGAVDTCWHPFFSRRFIRQGSSAGQANIEPARSERCAVVEAEDDGVNEEEEEDKKPERRSRANLWEGEAMNHAPDSLPLPEKRSQRPEMRGRPVRSATVCRVSPRGCED